MTAPKPDLARRIADRLTGRFAVGEIVEAEPPADRWTPCRHWAFASATTAEVAEAIRELFGEIGF